MKAVLIIAKTIATIVVYAALIGIMTAVLGYSVLQQLWTNMPDAIYDYLIYGAGLFAALAVPLHYKLRRGLLGLLSYLSIPEVFLFTLPTIILTFIFGALPVPFFPSDLPGLMIYRGVVILLIMAIPAGYALFNAYLVVERNIGASGRLRGDEPEHPEE